MNPVSYYRRVGADNLNNVKHTQSGSIEFLHITAGSGSVLAGSAIFPMIQGAVYVIDCCEPHCTCPEQPNEYRRSNFCMDKSDFYGFLKSACADDIYSTLKQKHAMCVPLSKEASEAADKCFEKLHRDLEEHTQLTVYGFFALLELSLILKDSHSPEVNTDMGIAGKAVEFIGENLCEDVSASAVSKALHVSKYHLCHTFHEKTGMTLSGYVLEKRLSKAESMLRKGVRPVGEIALELGFSSVSYFCSVFNKKYGMSPLAYRKSAASEADFDKK